MTMLAKKPMLMTTKMMKMILRMMIRINLVQTCLNLSKLVRRQVWKPMSTKACTIQLWSQLASTMTVILKKKSLKIMIWKFLMRPGPISKVVITGRLRLAVVQTHLGAKYLFFSRLVPAKREKNILVLLSLYSCWGKCAYFSIFEW